jgi:hypothetical protein
MDKRKILEKVDMSEEFGVILNTIQDVAYDNLPAKSVNRFLTASYADAEECDGCDYILLNGQVFDWKEFSSRKKEIVLAYLDYFTSREIETIYNNL